MSYDRLTKAEKAEIEMLREANKNLQITIQSIVDGIDKCTFVEYSPKIRHAVKKLNEKRKI